MARRRAREPAAPAGAGLRRRRGGHRGAEPRRDGRPADADRLRHRGAAAHEPAPARLRVLAPGQLGVAAAAGLEPHQPARLPRQRAVVHALRRADGAADGRPPSPSSGSCSTRFFAVDLDRPRARAARPTRSARRCRASPLAVVALTLAGFGAELGARASRRCGSPPRARWRSRCPRSRAARRRRGRSCWRPSRRSWSSSSASASSCAPPSDNGLASAVRAAAARRRRRCPSCSLIAAVSAILANLVNNLPATLILVPGRRRGGAGAGARRADRRQRRPEPDLRRLAGHAAVAAGAARRGHRRRARRVRAPRRAHRAGGRSSRRPSLLWFGAQVLT